MYEIRVRKICNCCKGTGRVEPYPLTQFLEKWKGQEETAGYKSAALRFHKDNMFMPVEGVTHCCFQCGGHQHKEMWITLKDLQQLEAVEVNKRTIKYYCGKCGEEVLQDVDIVLIEKDTIGEMINVLNKGCTDCRTKEQCKKNQLETWLAIYR